MKKFRILVSLCILIGASIYCYVNDSESVAQDIPQELYSWECFDKFRQMDYWAFKSLLVRDYDYESGDSAYLKLCSKDPNSSYNTIPNSEITDHYEKEFKRLIQGKIPFHDTHKDLGKRLDTFLSETGKALSDLVRDDPDRLREFEASEEARNRAMFGSHPGAFRCIIEISRREFPVLYEMTSEVRAGEIHFFRGKAELEEAKLGYSTPEHIVDELKRSMSEQFEALSKELSKIKSIKK